MQLSTTYRQKFVKAHMCIVWFVCFAMAVNLTFDEAFSMWCGLEVILGMDGLYWKSQYGYECLRETLMQLECLPLFKENSENMNDMLAMVKLLTALNSMTFRAVMGSASEISEVADWIENGRDIVPVNPPRDLSDFLAKNRAHVVNILGQSITELALLKSECCSELTNIVDLLNRIEPLLDCLAKETGLDPAKYKVTSPFIPN